MKTYLKTTDKQFYTSHIAFDHVNLTAIEVSNGSFNFINNFEDLEHLLDKIQYFIREGLIPCTREEFNEVLIRETKRLNEITKEL